MLGRWLAIDNSSPVEADLVDAEIAAYHRGVPPMRDASKKSLLRVLLLALVLLAAIGFWWAPTRPDSEVDVESGRATVIVGIGGLHPATVSDLGLDGQADSAANKEQRDAISLVFRVVDAVTHEGIVGAEIALFDSDESELGLRSTTGVDGRTTLPEEPRAVGVAAWAPGYEIGGVEAGVWTLTLRPCPVVEVRVVGASAALLRDYELFASLHYRGLSEPWEWARRLYESRKSERIKMQPTACEIPRPIEKPCKVVLHGRHRAAGVLSEFAVAWLGSTDTTVVFDAASYPVPTGHWARIKLLLPDPTKHPVGEILFEHEDQRGNWERWGRQGFDMRFGQTEVVQTFVELWPVRYRMRVRFGGENVGEFKSEPFQVTGGVRKTFRIREDGGQSITFRIIGVHGGSFRTGDTELRRGANPAKGFSEQLSPGVIRFTQLAPGRYEFRNANRYSRRTFAPRQVTLRKGQRLHVDIESARTACLRIQLASAGAAFTVSPEGLSNPIPRQWFIHYGKNQWVARLPVGSYRVRAGAGERRVVLARDGTTVRFSRE